MSDPKNDLRPLPNGDCPDGEDLILTLELDDGPILECSVLPVFPVDGRQYIALLPEGADEEDGDIYFYRYQETPEGEPVLSSIETDEEFDAVLDRYDEILDEAEYDQLVAADGEDE